MKGVFILLFFVNTILNNENEQEEQAIYSTIDEEDIFDKEQIETAMASKLRKNEELIIINKLREFGNDYYLASKDNNVDIFESLTFGFIFVSTITDYGILNNNNFKIELNTNDYINKYNNLITDKNIIIDHTFNMNDILGLKVKSINLTDFLLLNIYDKEDANDLVNTLSSQNINTIIDKYNLIFDYLGLIHGIFIVFPDEVSVLSNIYKNQSILFINNRDYLNIDNTIKSLFELNSHYNQYIHIYDYYTKFIDENQNIINDNIINLIPLSTATNIESLIETLFETKTLFDSCFLERYTNPLIELSDCSITINNIKNLFDDITKILKHCQNSKSNNKMIKNLYFYLITLVFMLIFSYIIYSIIKKLNLNYEIKTK